MPAPTKLLLTGPPASGKTTLLLEALRRAADAGDGTACLVVPTATMAQHLRHWMAREGLPLSPRAVQTLYAFIQPWAGKAAQIPTASLSLVCQEALERIRPPVFEPLRELPGFHDALASLLDELASAGCGAAALLEPHLRAYREAEFLPALAEVLAGAEEDLASAGLHLRASRLRIAASAIEEKGLGGLRQVFLDGFFTLTSVELDLVATLARHASVTITLPEWPGAETARRFLLEAGFTESKTAESRRQPRRVVVAAGNLEQEVNEMARRILEERAAGRRFHEMGIVVRGEGRYLPALRATLERLGIPARFYFAEPLSAIPVIGRVEAAVAAALRNWDHEALVDLLRLLPPSPDLDAAEFELLKRLPGQGLEALREAPALRTFLESVDRLSPLAAWRSERLVPGEWAKRLAELPRLLPAPVIEDGAPAAQVEAWRTEAAALRAFRAALEEAAVAAGIEPLPLAEFWDTVRLVVTGSELRVRDQRRDVVHVMDANEARQWELPVVFVGGLTEGNFPRRHSQNSLFSDRLRLALRESGYHLRTSAEAEVVERFLFDLAVSRATDLLVLSYPQFDNAGNETLPSFALQEMLDAGGLEMEECPAVRIRPDRPGLITRPPAIRDRTLRASVAERHAVITPSAVEAFLQCPYSFHARHTLGLNGRPPHPKERLDHSARGQIVHDVLAKSLLTAEDVETIFERHFSNACRSLNVPPGFRREALRLEMLASLRAFRRDESVPPGGDSRAERSFLFALPGGPTLRGRIDRIDRYPGHRALIIDFKYTRPVNLRRYISGHEDGVRVQAGVYLLAARECFQLEPAGVLFCAIRREVRWDGWHAGLPLRVGRGEEGGARLAELMQEAVDLIQRTVNEIAAGRIEPAPADPDMCGFCEFIDICRIETAAAPMTAGAAS